MKAIIYSVKDELQNKFHNPVFIPDGENVDDEAIRIFKYQVNNTGIWKDNPNDFALYRIGIMDDTTAVIVSDVKKICDGRSVVNGQS